MVPVISSPDLSESEPVSSSLRPTPDDQLPPEPITPVQTDRGSAYLGSTEASNTTEYRPQSALIQEDPAPARVMG